MTMIEKPVIEETRQVRDARASLAKASEEISRIERERAACVERREAARRELQETAKEQEAAREVLERLDEELAEVQRVEGEQVALVRIVVSQDAAIAEEQRLAQIREQLRDIQFRRDLQLASVNTGIVLSQGQRVATEASISQEDKILEKCAWEMTGASSAKRQATKALGEQLEALSRSSLTSLERKEAEASKALQDARAALARGRQEAAALLAEWPGQSKAVALSHHIREDALLVACSHFLALLDLVERSGEEWERNPPTDVTSPLRELTLSTDMISEIAGGYGVSRLQRHRDRIEAIARQHRSDLAS